MSIPIEHVRLLVADLDTANQILTDEQVAGYLALHGLSTEQSYTADGAGFPVAVRRAAADALDAIATSEALVSKVMRFSDGTSTDGAKVAAALHAQAASLRVLADQVADEADDAFGVTEFEPYPRPW